MTERMYRGIYMTGPDWAEHDSMPMFCAPGVGRHVPVHRGRAPSPDTIVAIGDVGGYAEPTVSGGFARRVRFKLDANVNMRGMVPVFCGVTTEWDGDRAVKCVLTSIGLIPRTETSRREADCMLEVFDEHTGRWWPVGDPERGAGDLGEVAYEAHREAMRAERVDVLPPFGDLNEQVKAVWRATGHKAGIHAISDARNGVILRDAEGHSHGFGVLPVLEDDLACERCGTHRLRRVKTSA